jgi:glucose/mannose transport system substrate-binding protein
MHKLTRRLLGAAAAIALGAGITSAHAADVEVTHWWTSGGEAAAVAEFAKAFDAMGGDKWVDGAIAGSGDIARPLIISRIKGGKPMAATQLNTGSDANELIKAGLMVDLTDLAEKEGWKDFIRPSKILDNCLYEGRVYCVPVNIHSAQWLWLNRKVFEDNGLPVPKNFSELVAAAPALKEKGIQPLSAANGWPVNLMMDAIMIGVGGVDLTTSIYRDRNVDAAAGPEMRKVFEAMDGARKLIDPNTIVAQWNEATALVIEGKAAGNVMGDWAQGEFGVAGKVAGKDYDCLAGLGYFPVLDTGGDSFFFPKNDDPAITAAQMKLASMMVSKPVQVAFNLKKGSLPIRGDVDLEAANDCMKKGIEILKDPKNIMPAVIQMIDRDSNDQIRDLRNEFFTDPNMTIEDAQAQFVEIIKNAKPL